MSTSCRAHRVRLLSRAPSWGLSLNALAKEGHPSGDFSYPPHVGDNLEKRFGHQFILTFACFCP